jgi:hypothetical protein
MVKNSAQAVDVEGRCEADPLAKFKQGAIKIANDFGHCAGAISRVGFLQECTPGPSLESEASEDRIATLPTPIVARCGPLDRRAQVVGRHSEEPVDFWHVSRVDELTMPNRVADDQNSLNPIVQLYPEPIRRAVLSIA